MLVHQRPDRVVHDRHRSDIRDLVVILDQDGQLEQSVEALGGIRGRAETATVLMPKLLGPACSAIPWGLDGVTMWLDLCSDMDDRQALADANLARVRQGLLSTAARSIRVIPCYPRFWGSRRAGGQYAKPVLASLRRVGAADIVIDRSNELMVPVEKYVAANPQLQILQSC